MPDKLPSAQRSTANEKGYVANFEDGPFAGMREERTWHADHPPLVIGLIVGQDEDGCDEAIYRFRCCNDEGEYVYAHTDTVRR